MIILMKANRRDSRGREDLGAINAGVMRHIGHATLNTRAASRRIRHRILLGMNRRLLMAIAHSSCVRGPRQIAVITCCHDAILAIATRDDDAPDIEAFAI